MTFFWKCAEWLLLSILISMKSPLQILFFEIFIFQKFYQFPPYSYGWEAILWMLLETTGHLFLGYIPMISKEIALNTKVQAYLVFWACALRRICTVFYESFGLKKPGGWVGYRTATLLPPWLSASDCWTPAPRHQHPRHTVVSWCVPRFGLIFPLWRASGSFLAATELLHF